MAHGGPQPQGTFKGGGRRGKGKGRGLVPPRWPEGFLPGQVPGRAAAALGHLFKFKKSLTKSRFST